MKILGLIVVACFALAAAGAAVIIARWFHAPDQVSSFVVAAIGAVASCYGPKLLANLARHPEAR